MVVTLPKDVKLYQKCSPENTVTPLGDLGHVTAVTRNHSKFLTSHSHSFAKARRAYWQVATYDYLSNFNSIYDQLFHIDWWNDKNLKQLSTLWSYQSPNAAMFHHFSRVYDKCPRSRRRAAGAPSAS